MTYEKPKVLGLRSAIEDIQSSSATKQGGSQNDGDSLYATKPAYEADE